MGGATSARKRGAARRAISVGITTSVSIAECGPCCSTAPTGIITVWSFRKKTSSSALVSSPRKTVGGFMKANPSPPLPLCASSNLLQVRAFIEDPPDHRDYLLQLQAGTDSSAPRVRATGLMPGLDSLLR